MKELHFHGSRCQYSNPFVCAWSAGRRHLNDIPLGTKIEQRSNSATRSPRDSRRVHEDKLVLMFFALSSNSWISSTKKWYVSANRVLCTVFR